MMCSKPSCAGAAAGFEFENPVLSNINRMQFPQKYCQVNSNCRARRLPDKQLAGDSGILPYAGERMNRFLVIFFLVIFSQAAGVSAPGVASGNVLSKIAGGAIDWTTGIIETTGIKSLDGKGDASLDREKALAAANQIAKAHLLKIVRSIPINPVLSVNDVWAADSAISEQVIEMIESAQTVKQEYLSDGTVEVTLRLNLYGGFSQLVLPAEIRQVEPIRPIVSVGGVTPEDGAGEVSLEQSKSSIYTGLIVDARGLDLELAMCLKIEDEIGHQVYGSAFVSREFAVQYGVVSYMKDLSAASQSPRVMENPLTVKGLRVAGAGGGTIIVSNTDAALIRSAAEHLSFLKKCRVIVVLE